MSFRLTKDELKQRDELVKRLSDGAVKLVAAVETYNASLAELQGPVEAAADEYNNVVAEATEFAENIASQADSDMADKSERWQEDERGQAAEAFKSEWENLSFDGVSIDFPEELSVYEPAHANDLEAAPELAE